MTNVMDGDGDWKQRNILDECPQHHRLVDPYNDDGIWALLDDGSNAPCHTTKWAENAATKLEKHKMKMHKLGDVDHSCTFTGIGEAKSKVKYLIPFAVRFKESKMVCHGTMESHELEDGADHLLLFTQQQQAQLGFLKCVRTGTMRSTVYGMQSFEIARHHLSGLYIMRIDHFLPGNADNYYTLDQKRMLFASPTQWDTMKPENNNAEEFDKMNEEIESRRKMLEGLGAEDGFGDLFTCINENNAYNDVEDSDTDIIEDWAEFARITDEKIAKGELDLSDYLVAVATPQNSETTVMGYDVNISCKPPKDILADNGSQVRDLRAELGPGGGQCRATHVAGTVPCKALSEKVRTPIQWWFHVAYWRWITLCMDTKLLELQNNFETCHGVRVYLMSTDVSLSKHGKRTFAELDYPPSRLRMETSTAGRSTLT